MFSIIPIPNVLESKAYLGRYIRIATTMLIALFGIACGSSRLESTAFSQIIPKPTPKTYANAALDVSEDDGAQAIVKEYFRFIKEQDWQNLRTIVTDWPVEETKAEKNGKSESVDLNFFRQLEKKRLNVEFPEFVREFRLDIVELENVTKSKDKALVRVRLVSPDAADLEIDTYFSCYFDNSVWRIYSYRYSIEEIY